MRFRFGGSCPKVGVDDGAGMPLGMVPMGAVAGRDVAMVVPGHEAVSKDPIYMEN